MSTELIKLKIKELFDNTPENVGVMFGKKVTNGKYTDETSIVFTVEKKIPINEIPDNEILPSTIEIDGTIYSTDVVEVGKIVPLACDTTTLNNCYSWSPVGTTFPPNRNIIRPLQGGVSLTSYSHAGTVGTLGFLAVDRTTNALVGVTNNHVVVKDAFYTAERDLSTNGVIENEVLDYAFQSGETALLYSQLVVGDVIRYQPIKQQPEINYVDGALVSIFSGTVSTGLSISTPKSWMQYGLTGITMPMPFATTAEIDNLIITPPTEVKSAGRTTGAKQGVCGLKVSGIHASITVGPYSLQGVSTNITYNECIAFTRTNPDCPYPDYAGDSGSALIAIINGKHKIIGLVFAGSGEGSSGTTGYACRIDKVAEALDIIAWDGANQNYINIDNKQFVSIPGGSYDKTLLCSGETYWQVGTTTNTYDCGCGQVKMTFTATTNTAVGFSIQGSANFNMTVNWGDGITSTFSNNTSFNPTHTYTTSGTYVVQVGFSNCSLINTLQVLGGNIYSPLIGISGLESLSSLVTLYLYRTKLTSFNPSVALPSTLQNLHIEYCSLSSFNPTLPLPTNLQFLSLNNNDIPSFNPTLPLPTNLQYLVLDSNLIPSFNPTLPLPNSLVFISISANLLTTFNPTLPLPTNLFYLGMSYNQITSFNPLVITMRTLGQLSLSTNLLDVSNVNGILTRMDTIPFTSPQPRLLELQFQTPPASPSGAGITAKVNLISRGWSVATD